MKLKTTLLLLAAFVALLAAVLILDKGDKTKEEAKARSEKLVDVASADVERMELKREDGTLAFKKTDKGEWTITAPLESNADAVEVNALADGFASLRIDRVVEASGGDPKAYEIPKREVALWLKGKSEPVRILVGMENPLDKALFAQRAGDPRIVLIPATLSTALDKTLFDFRQKDVFKVESSEVSGIALKARDSAWQAAKDGERWSLSSPVRGVAARTRIDAVIDGLSGLKAKEFAAEEKTPEALRKTGLDKAEYRVALAQKAAGREVVFELHKDGDKVYATSSQSNKIAVVDAVILADLDRKPDEYREKKVLDFYSWDADRVSVKDAAAAEIAAVKEKTPGKDGAEDTKWRLAAPGKEEADATKIESFLRRIEGLEAAEFADAAKPLSTYGLDAPRWAVKVRTQDYEKKVKEAGLLVGKEDPAKKQVFVKADGRDEVFLVDPAFLDDFPKAAKDWLPTPPPAEPKAEAKPAEKK